MAENTMAKIGDGANLFLGVSTITSIATDEATSNYTQIGQVLSFSPALECGEHDVTHMQSGGVRQFIPGHLAATIGMTINLLPASPTTDVNAEGILDVYQARTSRAWLLRIPAGQPTTSDPTSEDYALLGFITGYNWNVDRDSPNTADLTIRVSDSTIVEQGA